MMYPRVSLIALLVCHAANANVDVFEPLGPHKVILGELA